MTNYEKIKKLLETKTCTPLVKRTDGYKAIFTSIDDDGALRRSFWCNNVKDCYDDFGASYSIKKKIDGTDIKSITAIPISYKEIKGNVDIIDCEEIREIAEEDCWSGEQIDLIGKENLIIEEYFNDKEGQCYKIDCYYFPARFVIPTGCQTEENEIRLTEKELLESIDLLKKKLIVTKTIEHLFDAEFPSSRDLFENGDKYNSRKNAVINFIYDLLQS